MAPVIYFLNLYYCMTIIPKADRMFHPSRFAKGFGWFSLVVFTVLTSFAVMDRVFGVPLFGG